MLTRDRFDYFLRLHIDCQIAIIQQIDDDHELFKFLSLNRYTYSIFKQHTDRIFEAKVNSQLTEQPNRSFYIAYKNYLINKKRNTPFVKEIEENHTLLSYLVFKGYEKAVGAYLKTITLRSELNHKVRHGYNILHLAILSRNPAMVALILSQPESPVLMNEKNAYGACTLHFAAIAGNRLILKNIIEHDSFDKESINDRDSQAYSPLAYFCRDADNDDVDFLADLISYGAKTDETERNNPETKYCKNGIPASIAIRHSKPQSASVLLTYIKHNIEKYAVCPENMLGNAIEKGYTTIVKFFINDCGISISGRCNEEYSLLKASLRSLDKELIQIVFNLESPLYKKFDKPQIGNGWYIGSFDDYMLAAIRDLFSRPANTETLKIYQLLIELGFNTSMLTYSKNNVFHALAVKLACLVGHTEESIHCAREMIDDLLLKDSTLNFKEETNSNGDLPIQLLPICSAIDDGLIFSEKVANFIGQVKIKNEDSLVRKVDHADVENYAHDRAELCAIM